MCIAILQTQSRKKPLKKKMMETCWENNPDGMGFVYNKDNSLFYFHELEDFDTFYDVYRSCRLENPESIFLIHFRWATHGGNRVELCHPFFVSDEVAFIHNGVLDVDGIPKSESDTSWFNKSILQKLPDGWYDNDGIFSLIESFADASKLAFIRHDGTYRIVNEELGHWVSGVWFSNKGYETPRWARYRYSSSTANKSTQYSLPMKTNENQRSAYNLDSSFEQYTSDEDWYDQTRQESKPITKCMLCQEDLKDQDELDSGYCGYCWGTFKKNGTSTAMLGA